MKSINNTRFIRYAEAHRRDPADMLDQDRKRYPGAAMVGFVQWNQSKISEFRAAHPQAFFEDRLVDHNAYDSWLLENK